MNYFCPKCSTKINVEQLHPDHIVVVCETCNELLRIDRLHDNFGNKVPFWPRPRQVSINKKPQQLEARWRWWSSYPIESFIAGLFWLLLLIILFFPGPRETTSQFDLSFLPKVIVVSGFIYHVSATLFNSTTFLIDEKIFTIQHGPLPWIGNLKIDRAKIQKLAINIGRNSIASLSVIQNDETERHIVSTGSNIRIARYILYVLTEFMKMEVHDEC